MPIRTLYIFEDAVPFYYIDLDFLESNKLRLTLAAVVGCYWMTPVFGLTVLAALAVPLPSPFLCFPSSFLLPLPFRRVSACLHCSCYRFWPNGDVALVGWRRFKLGLVLMFNFVKFRSTTMDRGSD